jgi:hypothetical protein
MQRHGLDFALTAMHIEGVIDAGWHSLLQGTAPPFLTPRIEVFYPWRRHGAKRDETVTTDRESRCAGGSYCKA